MRQIAFALFITLQLLAQAEERIADVVIYGGTPAGIMAAVAASREGASVVIIEPTRWIGGMVTGGLGRTDIWDSATVGGYTREFFTRAATGYDAKFMWYAEPKVNLATCLAMLQEANVTTFTTQRLHSVARDGRRIASLTTTDGTIYRGTVFIDASYEGDLMAGAAVPCTYGRESREQYGEDLAGFYPMPIRTRSAEVMASEGHGPKKIISYIHGTPASIPGLDNKGRPLFGVLAANAEPGSADRLIQAYNYRLCVTERPDLKTPFPKPATYDPTHYELMRRLLVAFPDIPFGRIFHVGAIANGKYDLNAQGLVSTDYPRGNIGYIDGDEACRARIAQEHKDWILGLLWFLGHDEAVPQALRDQTNRWGLCRDEFADNENWPYALYVREARRMIGDYVMVQEDCQTRLIKPDSVAMGSFAIDCHIVQRILSPDGSIRDEGSFQDAPTKPYQIPYRSLTPKSADCTNLLVPVCLSASHIAICSLRMEPVYMALGHASGVAAAMVVKSGQDVQAVDIPGLQDRLRGQKAVLALGSP